MRINELQLDPNTINFLKSEGYTELYPPQEGCRQSRSS